MRDQFYAWAGGKRLYVLDPVSAAWTAVDGTGDDPGGTGWGSFGRFRYSERLGVFVAVAKTSDDVFLYKP